MDFGRIKDKSAFIFLRIFPSEGPFLLILLLSFHIYIIVQKILKKQFRLRSDKQFRLRSDKQFRLRSDKQFRFGVKSYRLRKLRFRSAPQ